MHSTNTDSILNVSDLRVSYGRKAAVRGVSFEVPRGRSVGLLGANGAGKSSTLRTIMGMLRPKSGTVRIFDSLPGSVAALKRLGYAPEEASPPEFLTAQEYLSIVGSLRGATSREEKLKTVQWCEWFALDPKKRVSNYSKGMRRRLVLAQAFVGNPELLILDEPLSGLDPLMIVRLREYLTDYRQSGGTVLFSSHILAEVEKACTDVVMMGEGQVIHAGPVSELLNQHDSVEMAFAALAGRPS